MVRAVWVSRQARPGTRVVRASAAEASPAEMAGAFIKTKESTVRGLAGRRGERLVAGGTLRWIRCVMLCWLGG